MAVLHLESSDLDAGRIESQLAAEAEPSEVCRARGRDDLFDALAAREFDEADRAAVLAGARPGAALRLRGGGDGA